MYARSLSSASQCFSSKSVSSRILIFALLRPNARWIVVPPARFAAIPDGAQTTTRPSCFSMKRCSRYVLPTPAPPVTKTFCPDSRSSIALTCDGVRPSFNTTDGTSTAGTTSFVAASFFLRRLFCADGCGFWRARRGFCDVAFPSFADLPSASGSCGAVTVSPARRFFKNAWMALHSSSVAKNACG